MARLSVVVLTDGWPSRPATDVLVASEMSFSISAGFRPVACGDAPCLELGVGGGDVRIQAGGRWRSRRRPALPAQVRPSAAATAARLALRRRAGSGSLARGWWLPMPSRVPLDRRGPGVEATGSWAPSWHGLGDQGGRRRARRRARHDGAVGLARGDGLADAEDQPAGRATPRTSVARSRNRRAVPSLAEVAGEGVHGAPSRCRG